MAISHSTTLLVMWLHASLLDTCMSSEFPTCPGFFKGCCPDFKWDERRESCIECSEGFTGVDCSTKCKYPYFGERCGKKCTCSNITCNHIQGCSIIEQ